MKKTNRGSALLLGAGTSILLFFVGGLLVAVYVFLSSKSTYYLSSYFTYALFVSVFCGGYVAGQKGGIRNWVPAGLIGVCTGGLALTLIYMLFPVAPGIRELLALLVLPAFFSSTGALAAANQGRRQQLKRNLGAQ
jgi:hypothetical membrane protein